MNVLIAGASGNLGSHLARHLLNCSHRLRLLVHKRSLPPDLAADPTVSIVQGDLDSPTSLLSPTRDIDCIVYLAGVLFRPRPEKFLHRTNTVYVQNIVKAALVNGVRKFILVSFPHVEGETTPDSRAMGKLAAHPVSIHARTRLEAEKYLFTACEGNHTKPLVLRAGVIYGRGVKLTEAARKLMRFGLLAIWNKPTWVHLLSLPDFLRIVELTIERDNLSGIYNLSDDQPITLQGFLDEMARHWGYRKPWRVPVFCVQLAATLCETFAMIFHARTPLTRDIVKMAMTSVVADSTRMKQEILPELSYPTFKKGVSII
jgi:nucleoside-diphosphate-sugar epimerase